MHAMVATMMVAASIAFAGGGPAAFADEAPATMAEDERSFFHVPSSEDFRLQRISRTDREREWPFTVDQGYLTCAYVVGRPAVYFTEMPDDDDTASNLRTVIVSVDPLELTFGNLGSGGLIREAASVAALIRLMAPFESLGARLCDQPRGAEIGSGEL